MSADVKHYAPAITQYLDFATADVYLLKHGVLSLLEHGRFSKALQTGSSTNSDLVRNLLPRIFERAREFYRALRDFVDEKTEDVHSSNIVLFRKLPENFVSA